ncbi:hypothetical protein ACU8KH_05271 [Lachancea thermotolerans]
MQCGRRAESQNVLCFKQVQREEVAGREHTSGPKSNGTKEEVKVQRCRMSVAVNAELRRCEVFKRGPAIQGVRASEPNAFAAAEFDGVSDSNSSAACGSPN